MAIGAAVALLAGLASGLTFSRLQSAGASEQTAEFVIPTPLPGPPTVTASPAAHPVRTARAAPKLHLAFPDYSATCGRKGARVFRYRVLVDRGAGVSVSAFKAGVRAVLCDPRSWIASGRVRFVYDPHGSHLISLRTPDGTEDRCLDLTGQSVHRTYSCAGSGEAVLNSARWLHGSPTLALSVAQYRALMTNHEVGHLLGQRHRMCSGAGRAAPVMMQQSKGLYSCRANEWPLGYEIRSVRF
jgi:hypothetical protein